MEGVATAHFINGTDGMKGCELMERFRAEFKLAKRDPQQWSMCHGLAEVVVRGAWPLDVSLITQRKQGSAHVSLVPDRPRSRAIRSHFDEVKHHGASKLIDVACLGRPLPAAGVKRS